MNTISKITTAESVTAGHPDKVCDQISDAVLDALLEKDPQSRVAVESFGSHGLVVIGGEVTSSAKVDFADIARRTYRDIGYCDKPKMVVNVRAQSPDIAVGVDTGGAGDQGIMYGYATDETPEFLPPVVVLAHKLTRGLEDLRRNNPDFEWLEPDGKAQITMDGPVAKSVLVSCQHKEEIDIKELREAIREKLILPIVGEGDYDVLINPTGKFVQGGFDADTGLTGRKIMVDTYGGIIPHGGGCFSGKDPTKVDRSAAYMARFAAKNIVANGYAKKCLVSVAYAIGKKEPLMLEAETFGTGNTDMAREILGTYFNFAPLRIIKALDLRRPIYLQTAAYGHFGKPDLPWEKIVKL